MASAATGLLPANVKIKKSRKGKNALPVSIAPSAEDEDDTPINVDNDNEVLDDKGNLIKIQHSDGSITISTDGRPLRYAEDPNPRGWYGNLSDKVSDSEK